MREELELLARYHDSELSYVDLVDIMKQIDDRFELSSAEFSAYHDLFVRIELGETA